MKKILLLVVVGCLSFLAWQQRDSLPARWEAVMEKASRIFTMKEDVEPQVVEEPRPPAVPQPRIVIAEAPKKTPDSGLPDGVYYTRERISETTDSGVHSIAAGIKVQKTGEAPGQITVEDDRATVTTDISKLTRDDREIRALLTATKHQAASAKMDQSRLEAKTRDENARTTMSANASAATALRAQLIGLDSQIESLNNELNRLSAKEYAAKLRGNTSSYGAPMSRIQSQIIAVQAQRDTLQMKLQSMP